MYSYLVLCERYITSFAVFECLNHLNCVSQLDTLHEGRTIVCLKTPYWLPLLSLPSNTTCQSSVSHPSEQHFIFMASLVQQWDPCRCNWFRESSGRRLTEGNLTLALPDRKNYHKRGDEPSHSSSFVISRCSRRIVRLVWSKEITIISGLVCTAMWKNTVFTGLHRVLQKQEVNVLKKSVIWTFSM